MEDHLIECPRCKAEFSLEQTRCPQCGLNMYPEDEDEVAYSFTPEDEEPGGGSGEVLWAIILGWILAGALIFIVNAFASQAEATSDIPAGWAVALFLAGPLGAAVGGVAAAVIAPRGRLVSAGIGALVGVGAAAMSVLFETRWRLVTLQVLLEWQMLANYGLCILLGVAAGWLKGGAGSPVQAPGRDVKGTSWEDLMYRDLLSRVRFNRATAERLIEFEQKLDPEADRYTLLKNAVERLERDRR